MKYCRNFILFLSVIVFSSCASLGTYNPATGRTEFLLLSTQQEILFGQDIHETLEKEYAFSKDTQKNARLNKIAQKITLVSDRQDYSYQFFLIESDELNAFTTPGGNIYFFTGLFDKLTDGQVAAVLAHEVGHCAAKHTAKKFQTAMGYDLIQQIILSRVSVENAQIAKLSAAAVSNIVFSAYSRSDEYEADRLAVKYLHLSGYRPENMIESLQVLQKESKPSYTPTFLRSHPHLKERILALEGHIQALNRGNS